MQGSQACVQGSPDDQCFENSDLLFCHGLARLFELSPFRCVLQCLVVFRNCRLRLTLTSECVAPAFERIGKVRARTVAGFELPSIANCV